MDTDSLSLTYHFAGQLHRRMIAVRMELRCGYAPCSEVIVVYRMPTEIPHPAYYCRKTHKNKASVARNGRRTNRGAKKGRRSKQYGTGAR
jgi:hypothetical protein